MYYFLGSEPIEPTEADDQWFIVGSEDGKKKALFTNFEDAKDYIRFINQPPNQVNRPPACECGCKTKTEDTNICGNCGK